MDQFVKIVIGAGATIIGTTLLYKGFEAMHRFRMVKDVPRSAVRSIAMGLVEIHGKAKVESELISPLSHIPCIWYKYEIQVYKRRGKHSQWVTVKKGEKSKPFFAVDETGEVYVSTVLPS